MYAPSADQLQVADPARRALVQRPVRPVRQGDHHQAAIEGGQRQHRPIG